MVKAGILDIRFLLDEENQKKEMLRLPAFRREKALQQKTALGRAQSIGAWILYEEMCRRFDFTKEMAYNLSHSGDYAMCAISSQLPEKARDLDSQMTCQVGCDIECAGAYRQKVAKRFYCEAEYAWIESQKTEKDKCLEFYRFWVLKESFMKATRRGMSLSTLDFEIQIVDGRAMLIRRPEEYKQEYIYQEYNFPENIVPEDISLEAGNGATENFGMIAKAAVCTTDKEVDGKIWVLEYGLSEQTSD